jgi:hypothetical protein
MALRNKIIVFLDTMPQFGREYQRFGGPSVSILNYILKMRAVGSPNTVVPTC